MQPAPAIQKETLRASTKRATFIEKTDMRPLSLGFEVSFVEENLWRVLVQLEIWEVPANYRTVER